MAQPSEPLRKKASVSEGFNSLVLVQAAPTVDIGWGPTFNFVRGAARQVNLGGSSHVVSRESRIRLATDLPLTSQGDWPPP